MKLVCVTKFMHSRVFTRIPVYRFTLQLLVMYRLSFEISRTAASTDIFQGTLSKETAGPDIGLTRLRNISETTQVNRVTNNGVE